MATALGPIIALTLAVPAAASEAPADTSALSLHGSPTGEVVPQPTVTKEMRQPEKEGFPLSLVMHAMSGNKGMLVTLPMIDTDPNRGFTFGFLPIWIINSSTTTDADARIKSMHAPSLTFNPIFKTNLTYRYYNYPTKDSSLQARGSISQVVEKELFLEYDDSNFWKPNGEVGWKLQYNVDASGRFFGFGPNTKKDLSGNYEFQTAISDAYFGLPIYEGSNWYWTVEDRFSGNRISDGPIKTAKVQGITTVFPGVAPDHFHQTDTLRAYITYDNLDSEIATTRGNYDEFFVESSQRAFASEYTFQRYSVDLKHFQHLTDDDTYVTAARFKFEQVVGDGVPFYLQPALGGRSVFPAYGDGRFTTRGVMAGIVEQRFALFKTKTAGVTVKFEVAPFAGLGSAFDTPRLITRRYARPLFGLGLRAVAAPQVVGSIDFGYGQEGMSTFMDINYPF